ncbi:MAG: type II toxin-antitoxin system RelE/ParE family toxin [Caulobacteraceae bacterium]
MDGAALRDLDAIAAYISDFNPSAARKLAADLRRAAQTLADFPQSGRVLSARRRELATVPPYLIRYRIVGAAVEILTIRHGARRPV